MNYNQYFEKSRELLSSFNEYLGPGVIPAYQMQYNLVSAGLSNFLPALPSSRHAQVFKGVHLHQQLSSMEQYCHELTDHLQCQNLTAEHWQYLRKGCILCTYHTGSYRAINLFLAHHKIDFVLVISDKMYRSQQKEIQNNFNEQKKINTDLTIINAEEAGALLKMIRQLKAGKTLVLYADGNTGTGAANHDNKNCCVVPFLAQAIKARTGIAYLAAITGTAILPVWSYRKTINDIYLHFDCPLKPDAAIPRQLFVKNTTYEIYRKLAHITYLYPEQWEGWLYIHNMLHIVSEEKVARNPDIQPGTDYERFYFNCQEFGIFKQTSAYFLFRKSGFLSFSVEEDIYYLLLNAAYTPIGKSLMQPQLLQELVENNVLLRE